MLAYWDYMQENSPKSITARIEWCCTLWTWRRIRLHNWQQRSGVICYWSCLVRSWSFRNGGSLGAKRILKRSEITWTSEESSGVPRRVRRWGRCVVILNGVRFLPLHPGIKTRKSLKWGGGPPIFQLSLGRKRWSVTTDGTGSWAVIPCKGMILWGQ